MPLKFAHVSASRLTGKILLTIVAMTCILLVLSEKPIAETGTCRIAIQNAKGTTVFLNAEIANNEFRRRKGLMFRKSMPENSGMLFVFEYDQKLSFWMRNTYIPLSIAFIDRQGNIKEIYDMKPLDEVNICNSKTVVRYALEVNRGWFTSNHIIPGCRVHLHGCIGK